MSPRTKAEIQTRDQYLAAVVEDHRGQLLATIGRLMRDGNEAEDVLQEVFAEFTEAYDLDSAIESVGAWLTRVARNKVFDRFRRRKTQNDYRLLVQEASEEESSSEPGNEWMREWFRDKIAEALEQLPAEQREVFVMHELEGKSFEEIARETGVGVNTLLSRKRYAVLSLREYLKEVYDALEP